MLRAWVPELSFHDDFKPILSLDCHPSGRFLTSGVDHHIRVWRVDPLTRSPDGCPHISFLSQAPDSGDPKPVNVVRFSPSGDLFAAASDNATITLYALSTASAEVDSAAASASAPAEEAKAASDGTGVESMDLDPLIPACSPADASLSDHHNEAGRDEEKEPKGKGKEEKEEFKEGKGAGKVERAVIELDMSADDFTPTPTTPQRPTSTPVPPSSPIPAAFAPDPDFSSLNLETYQRVRVLRGHLQEVYALSFSPCSAYLLSGSIDGRVHLWDVASGRSVKGWEDHHGYVQGVVWDPLGAFIVSVSSDRTVKVYQRRRPRGKDPMDWRPHVTLKTRRLPPTPKAAGDDEVVVLDSPAAQPQVPTAEAAEGEAAAPAAPVPPATAPLFVDETLPSFFRRPAWSPCGGWLLLPCGVTQEEGKTVYCSWLYNRDNLSTPVACLPHPEPSVACAFSPFPYHPPPPSPAVSASMPVALLFCVATTKSVFLYTTHCATPLGLITSLHLSALTEVAWCKGGVSDTTDRLLVSSSDGYVSVIEMEDVAVKLSGDELSQWKATIDARREAIKLSWEGVDPDTEVKTKRKKKKKVKPATGDAGTTATVDPLNAVQPLAGEGGEGKEAEGEEKKEVTVKAEFVLTEEMITQLAGMVEAGHKVTADAVRTLCEVSANRAQKMARKWKELQRSKKKAAAEAKAAAAKEEKAASTAPSDEGAGDKADKAKKEKGKEKKKSVDDAVKSMKKLDMFFTKSTAPVFFEPPPKPPATEGEINASAVSASSQAAAGTTQAGDVGAGAAPSPLPAGGGRVKRKISPTLVEDGSAASAVPTATTAPPPAKQRDPQSAKGKQKGKGKGKGKGKKKPGPTPKKQKTTATAAAPTASASSTPSPPLSTAASSSSSTPIDLTGDAAPQMPPPPSSSTPALPTVVRRTSGGHRVMLSPPAAEESTTKPLPLLAFVPMPADAALMSGAATKAAPTTPAAVSSFFTPTKRQKRTIAPLFVSADEGKQPQETAAAAPAEAPTAAVSPHSEEEPLAPASAAAEETAPPPGSEVQAMEVEALPV